MSGPSRIRFAAGLVLAGLSSSPASSNPFTTLFNSAPEQAAAAPAPAKEECLLHPGKPADGQHWVYRVDGHRKCWFSVPAEPYAATKPVRRYAASRRLDADEDKAALPKAEAVEDAHAELLRPTTPAETPQPTPSTVQAVDVAEAAPVPTGAAALVPPPPVLSKPDQVKPDDANPAPSTPETHLAATPADSDAIAVSVPAATSLAAATVETGDERQWWTAPWLGPLLMAAGALVLLLSPIWPRPRAALVAERPWCPDVDDREDLSGSDFSPRTRPRDRRHAQATPRPLRPRQSIEGQRTSRLPRQRQDVTFQEAINALTDVSNS